MSTSELEDEMEFESEGQAEDQPGTRTTILPAPTVPASMSDERAVEQVPATGGARSDGPDKVPFLVKLGHRLCGFSR